MDAAAPARNTPVNVKTYTLESAYASVPALDPPRDAKAVERSAKEEKAARTIRELRQP